MQVNPSENPLWIYLHAGGRKAVYYGLFNDAKGRLDYITVKVQSALPSNALLLARGPINALLDVMVRNYPMPLLIQRLDLMSPTVGDVLLWNDLFNYQFGFASRTRSRHWLCYLRWWFSCDVG
jgi:hypothetical protein